MPSGSGEVAQQYERGPPEQAPCNVVESELAVGHLSHPCEPRHHHAKRRGEPTDEHCHPTASAQVSAGGVQVLVDPAPEERHSRTQSAKDLMTPTPADEVPHAVSDDGPRDSGDDHSRERNPPVESENPSKQDGDFAGEEEAQEG